MPVIDGMRWSITNRLITLPRRVSWRTASSASAPDEEATTRCSLP